MTRLALVISYTILSILYFVFLDPHLYIKNIFKNDITFVFPVPYVILVGLFIYSYARVAKESIKKIAYPIIAMAILLPLFYLLSDLKIGMIATNPFRGNRGVYGIYGGFYFLFVMFIFAALSGAVLRKVIDDKKKHFEEIAFHAPIFAYLILIISLLFINKLSMYGAFCAVFFAVFFLFKEAVNLFSRIIKALKIIFKDERAWLVTIFILALLVRCFWGWRIMAITGDNFIRASDDGITYDPFAALIAQGGTIPKADAFYWSGFGYWYFLAGIYKIFGLHNFKAAVIIQSALGSLVPVFTYYIGKNIFKSRFVAVLASIMTAFNMTLVFLSVVIGMEAIYIPLFTMAMAVAVYMLASKNFNYKNAFVIGCVVGLANIARSEVLFFPIILSALIFFFMRNRLKIKSVLLSIAALFVGFILLMSIQHVANYAKYGEYKLTSGGLGDTYAGVWGTNENMLLDSLGFNPFKSLPGSIAAFSHDPETVSKLLVKGFIKRLTIYYFRPNFGVFDPVYLVNPASGYFFRFPIYVQLFEYIFIFVGIFFAFRNKENLIGKTMLVVFPVYLSSMYSFIWVTNSRHRGILIPIFSVFLFYGVKVFSEHVKNYYERPEKIGGL